MEKCLDTVLFTLKENMRNLVPYPYTLPIWFVANCSSMLSFDKMNGVAMTPALLLAEKEKGLFIACTFQNLYTQSHLRKLRNYTIEYRLHHA